MSDLIAPAMPAQEAETRLARIALAVDEIWDDLIALYQGRAWVSLGLPSWDALCDSYMRFRPSLDVIERRIAVNEMTGAGMSTRAIGTALGVSNFTVNKDQESSGVRNLTPETTGLDGKKYTRPDPAAQKRADEFDPALDEWIMADGSIRKANLRADFSKWLYQISRANLFDVDEMADLARPEDRESAERIASDIAAWFGRYLAATAPKPSLRVIGGGR